ncbi:MAG TPA: polymorphic toxin-type HINT domain-containing protein, partial [Lacipirellulaceae bacterium]|nr:polymorphic toxin-type HINT domain-containing protein [Lacipirellulaceae bacterium]
AQHPVTGELDFRPVLGTTVGRPTGVVNLKFDQETIGATLGHRFWVNAQGWRMAKELETQATLHALAGPVQLRSVEKAETVDCYTLIVDDFHTFFVGKSQLLVHDFGCPRPVTGALPGLQARGRGGNLPGGAVAAARRPGAGEW